MKLPCPAPDAIKKGTAEGKALEWGK